MKTYILNGKMLQDREAAHAYLARMLALPDWYGRNLDALYDCLTEMGPGVLVLLGADDLRREGGYGEKLLQTLADGVRNNPGLRLIYDESEDVK